MLDKCLEDLLDPSKEEERLKVKEFFKTTEMSQSYRTFSEFESGLYAKCLEVYLSTGVNYISDYRRLLANIECSGIGYGIKEFRHFESEDSYEYIREYKRVLHYCITSMRFFNISVIHGISLAKLERDLLNADSDWEEMQSSNRIHRIKSSEYAATELKKEYNNFETFDNDVFEEIYRECMNQINFTEKQYTFNEVLDAEMELEPGKQFIVYLLKDGKVCCVGRTSHLVTYIPIRLREYECDKVAFYQVDKRYIDDIYIKSVIEFDMSVSSLPKATNRKYVTFSKVKKMLKSVYNINITHIRKIMDIYDVERFLIGDNIILDKIELDKAVKKYLDME